MTPENLYFKQTHYNVIKSRERNSITDSTHTGCVVSQACKRIFNINSFMKSKSLMMLILFFNHCFTTQETEA